MKPGDTRTIVLNLISSVLFVALVWLLQQPLAVPLVVGFCIDVGLFAALAWLLLRFGPGLMRETPMATRRMVLAAFAIAVIYVSLNDARDGSVALTAVPLVAGATVGMLATLRRTRPSIGVQS